MHGDRNENDYKNHCYSTARGKNIVRSSPLLLSYVRAVCNCVDDAEARAAALAHALQQHPPAPAPASAPQPQHQQQAHAILQAAEEGGAGGKATREQESRGASSGGVTRALDGSAATAAAFPAVSAIAAGGTYPCMMLAAPSIDDSTTACGATDRHPFGATGGSSPSSRHAAAVTTAHAAAAPSSSSGMWLLPVDVMSTTTAAAPALEGRHQPGAQQLVTSELPCCGSGLATDSYGYSHSYGYSYRHSPPAQQSLHVAGPYQRYSHNTYGAATGAAPAAWLPGSAPAAAPSIYRAASSSACSVGCGFGGEPMRGGRGTAGAADGGALLGHMQELDALLDAMVCVDTEELLPAADGTDEGHGGGGGGGGAAGLAKCCWVAETKDQMGTSGNALMTEAIPDLLLLPSSPLPPCQQQSEVQQLQVLDRQLAGAAAVPWAVGFLAAAPAASGGSDAIAETAVPPEGGYLGRDGVIASPFLTAGGLRVQPFGGPRSLQRPHLAAAAADGAAAAAAVAAAADALCDAGHSSSAYCGTTFSSAVLASSRDNSSLRPPLAAGSSIYACLPFMPSDAASPNLCGMSSHGFRAADKRCPWEQLEHHQQQQQQRLAAAAPAAHGNAGWCGGLLQAPSSVAPQAITDAYCTLGLEELEMQEMFA
ncbi:hypothetical protein HXX76_002139 [Chlamydomonas incerta]|uniref:Uncharacterized protein n=1 Tax=Chlamydomonas incerta TaxID=51695 RepID=A0A836B074_CHLIN|nr:hypothetical protein HXX76_002139 [Chlamydomonas incerta]|eukprot:KAG2443796.1 hypothetical protein HXX76_002139 [Chlamydomonas incerta]